MRKLIPDARRLFRLILPWVVFVWIALPVHACGAGPAAMPGMAGMAAMAGMAGMAGMDDTARPPGCPLCPADSAKHARSAAHCPTPGPRAVDSRPTADPLPVAIALPGSSPTTLVRRSRGPLLRVARAPCRHRPLHLEKRVFLI